MLSVMKSDVSIYHIIVWPNYLVHKFPHQEPCPQLW